MHFSKRTHLQSFCQVPHHHPFPPVLPTLLLTTHLMILCQQTACQESCHSRCPSLSQDHKFLAKALPHMGKSTHPTSHWFLTHPIRVLLLFTHVVSATRRYMRTIKPCCVKVDATFSSIECAQA